MKSFFLSVLILFSAQVFGQTLVDTDLAYPRMILDTLTSDAYAGRGYVDNGMEKAADFIQKEFERIGLEKLEDSYFQEFEMPINIIENAELTINGQKLRYGYDFIVKPGTKSQAFKPKDVYHFNPENFVASLENEEKLTQFIIDDMRGQTNKHIVFPPRKFEVDSLNQYYKGWPQFYKADENRNRLILLFTQDKLISSLSQTQDSIAQLFVKDEFYTNNLKIDDYKIETRFVPDFKAKNVIGKIEGERSDSLIVITAHYDHLGKIGDVYFPGGSDNASGTAFILELAKYFKKHPPKFTLVFIAFAAEEAGLVGSRYFVNNPLVDLSKIKFLLNFDIMGAADDGIQIVNSSIFEKEYERLNDINNRNVYTPQIKKRGEACNSDHCPFFEVGVPSFFTYTLGGPGYYHDIFDTGDSVPLNGFVGLQWLFREFIEGF